ncbi:RNA-directed RNA polymerase [ssRNA phage SRR6960797_3]|uniref:RNA-directed RNA polymerase n=1 Tax=ssRNA phage SRR6960797_3 TaxID=2786563 RepID=A0A8S5L130_9VIRU|nr:RNA-directed RNA polymerase [ssRNA phage SRR6960797_3]DAD51045.1 TPA_asm: RNA-directed RNA polymerase [ssRNA phage SRR6960797_3]
MDYSSCPFNGQTEFVVSSLLSSLNTPRSLAAWLLYKNAEFDQLVNLQNPDPLNYTCATAFFSDYQATVLCRKAEFLPLDVDLETVALRKLEACEESCKAFNQNLEARLVLYGESPEGCSFRALMVSVRKIIRRVLGRFDEGRFLDSCGWGPGATSTIPRVRASLVDKVLETKVSVSSSALSYARIALGRDLHWARARGIPADGPFTALTSEFEIVKGNRVTFVPKDARSHRAIAIEPTMNLFLQKGIGSMMRDRLLKAGIDLSDQSINQRLARRGSLDGSLATLDLSSASDTVSRKLVEYLLPEDWLTAMNRTRCAFSEVNGEMRWNEKYSSMGNGYTFELESLIFYAVGVACCEFVSVYGDDIVCDTSSSLEMCDSLEALGFKLNREKSFRTSDFRESCGAHYFRGVDVKPIYIKGDPFGSIANYFPFVNGLLHRSRFRRDISRNVSVAFGNAWKRATRDYTWQYLSVTDGYYSARDTGVALPVLHPTIQSNCSRTEDFHKSGWFGVKLPCVSYRTQRLLSHEQDALYSLSLRFRPETPLSLGITSPVMDGRHSRVLSYRLRRRIHWYVDDSPTNYASF